MHIINTHLNIYTNILFIIHIIYTHLNTHTNTLFSQVVAVASWCARPTTVTLTFDWEALGLTAGKLTLNPQP